MNFYYAETKVNKKKIEKSGKEPRLTTSIITLALISLLLISAPVTLFSTTVFADDEPSLSSILNELGFTNIAISEIESFPSGTFQATLLAEFARYHQINTLSYYSVETSNFQTIFAGLEGATGDMGGYVIPPISKIFEVDTPFGLSVLSTFRYFSEHSRNPDFPEQHVKIYVDLDSPSMFLIGFEDYSIGQDRDYNDMVFSLEQIFPPEIISVNRSPQVPIYNQSVMVTAQVIKGKNEIKSVILSYQLDSSSWTNVTMNLDNSGYVATIPAAPYNRIVNYKVYATDTKGYSDVSTLDSYTTIIPGRSPSAVLLHSPSIVYTGEVVDFNATASYDPDGIISSFNWDFGDGTTNSEPTVSHSYIENGLYTVTLRVFDNEDLVGSSTAIQIVKNRSPVAALTETKSIIEEKEIVSFDASPSYDDDGTIISYTWSFGDGTAATGITVTHNYANAGLYDITLTVNDNDGATGAYKHTLEVTEGVNVAPVALFTVTAETVDIKQIISFNGSESYDSDGSIVTYSWDFGDGTTATGVEVDHQYENMDVYTVKLTIIDEDGATNEATSLITVSEQGVNESPLASFITSATTVMQNEIIHFDASESKDNDGRIVTYKWDFGDGSTATGVTADHGYSVDGNYKVTLIVTDNDGISSSIFTEIVVKTENNTDLAIISGIGITATALIAMLLYILIKRNKKKQS
jgi:PKD repeat protein